MSPSLSAPDRVLSYLLSERESLMGSETSLGGLCSVWDFLISLPSVARNSEEGLEGPGGKPPGLQEAKRVSEGLREGPPGKPSRLGSGHSLGGPWSHLTASMLSPAFPIFQDQIISLSPQQALRAEKWHFCFRVFLEQLPTY